MADSSSSSSGGGHHTSASPSTATHPSTASFDGGLLLRLLQNPDSAHPRAENLAPDLPSPGTHQTHDFTDPAVAAVGPLFAAAQTQVGGFGWSSTSTSTSHLQQQLRFPDPRFAPGEPFASVGGRGFGSGDAVRAERPRPCAPPPGFGRPSHAPAAARDSRNAFGGVSSSEHPVQYHPRPSGFGSTSNRELQTAVRPIADGIEAVARMPHGFGEQLSMSITGGCHAAVGMMYREQQQDHLLSPFGRMPLGEQHTLPILGGRRLHGDQYTPPVQECRAKCSGHGQHEPRLTNLLQREQKGQGLTEEKGYALRKVASVNAHCTSGKALVKELHHVTIHAGSSVAVDLTENQANALECGRIGEVVLEHGINGNAVAEARKFFEVPYQKGELRFAGHDEQDGDDKEDSIIDQMTENLVIDGNGDAKGVVFEKNIPRSKVNWIIFIKDYEV